MGISTRSFNRVNLQNIKTSNGFTDVELFDRAVELATRLHMGQIDKNGVDYIEHPLAVASLLTNPKAKIVAVLHDVLEDTDITSRKLRILKFPEDIVEALELLNHKKGEPYAGYINRLKTNELAREVKRADIMHNSSPERMKLLPEATRLRLEKKYKLGLDLLDV